MSVTWIEASAGTGKTYTLVRRVVDLVVGGMPVEKILLVTFTDKATAELKTRIRQGLREAWKATKEPRLAQALEDIPSLAITTIHGFCRALLTQFPLESGVSFEPEMVDQGRQWRRLLREQLRPHLGDLDPSLLVWAGLEDEEDLLSLAQEALNRNLFSLTVIHPDRGERQTFAKLRCELEGRNGPLWDAINLGEGLELAPDPATGLGTDPATYFKSNWYQKPYRAMRALLACHTYRDLIAILEPANLELLAKWDEESNIWKKGAPAELPPRMQTLREVARAFTDAAEAWSSALPGVNIPSFTAGCARFELLDQLCRPVLEKRSNRELTFHDLIDRVHRLVTTESGAALRAGAAARWKSILIDEFQDTDVEQWEIFRALFADDEHDLVLVGDPKQSIYRFRGADLEVYRAVRAEVRAGGATELLLEENFRSTAPMVEAVNALFDPAVTAWPHPDDFHPSRKGDKAVGRLVCLGEGGFTEVPPLTVFTPTDEAHWHRHLVSVVLSFLDGRHYLDDGAQQIEVNPGDFLVLVRQKREAWALQRLFTAKGIPATVGGSGGLLKGREAQEILLFLKALESPRSVSAARALGWTRLFAGATVEMLAPALDEARADRDRGAYLRAFRRVAAALEPGVSDGGGLEKLLGLPGGPRIVTNAEHVLELVQERHHRGEIPPGQVALSLETWMASGLQEDEVDLRRDREAPTLRLMTVHAAKGLEAPIVLHGRPSTPKPDRNLWIVHRGVDFLRTPEGVEAEQANQQAEDLRLKYVALTRARTHQVYLDESASASVPVWSTEDWQALPAWVPPTHTLPEAPDLHPPLPGLEGRHPWVESHSGLWRRATKGTGGELTQWDKPRVSRDEELNPTDEQPLPGGLADQLPAGADFGDLVHDILEEVDFGDPEHLAEVAELQCQRRRASFQNRDLTKPLTAWLGQVLGHRLDLGPGTTGVTFSQLPLLDTRRELEFHLPLAQNQVKGFRWGEHGFTVHPGYLTGRIDLLFRWQGKLYLADWKTNRLTPGQNLSEVMAEAGYDLQAQWYWEALKRLCALQGETLVPGGVLYVFLRGEGDRPRGVFLDPDHLNAITTLSPFLQEAAGV